MTTWSMVEEHSRQQEEAAREELVQQRGTQQIPSADVYRRAAENADKEAHKLTTRAARRGLILGIPDRIGAWSLRGDGKYWRAREASGRR